MSPGTELWHTNTSYFRLQRSLEFRADCGCTGFEGAVPGDDDDEEQNDDADEGEGEVDTLLSEEFFVIFASCSCCAVKDPLDFKSFWNQPEMRKTNCTYF